MGRALLCGLSIARPVHEVSILARLVGRALRLKNTRSTTGSVFQSSPASWDGRFSSGINRSCRAIRFNPRPPRGTGASTPKRTIYMATPSFNPRPPRGTGASTIKTGLPTCAPVRFNPRPPRGTGASVLCNVSTNAYQCFNPRPPRGTGASPFTDTRVVPDTVSILARLVGRALHNDCQLRASK